MMFSLHQSTLLMSNQHISSMLMSSLTMMMSGMPQSSRPLNKLKWRTTKANL